MSQTTLNTRIKLRNDTLASFTSANPVLLKGEVAVVETTDEGLRFKVGDGVTAFNSLHFYDEDSDYKKHIILGYYYNGSFYKEVAHTTAYKLYKTKLYVDLSTTATYHYDGTSLKANEPIQTLSIVGDSSSGLTLSITSTAGTQKTASLTLSTINGQSLTQGGNLSIVTTDIRNNTDYTEITPKTSQLSISTQDNMMLYVDNNGTKSKVKIDELDYSRFRVGTSSTQSDLKNNDVLFETNN